MSKERKYIVVAKTLSFFFFSLKLCSNTPTPLPSAGKQEIEVLLLKKKIKLVGFNHDVIRLEQEAWLEVRHL